MALETLHRSRVRALRGTTALGLLLLLGCAGTGLKPQVSSQGAGTWAVAVDGDETIVSNVGYERERVAAGADFDETSWRRWVARQDATAIPGAREFLLRVHELGGRIAIVTNRREVERADTEANLRALGLPFDVVLLRTNESRKESRWSSVAAGTADLPPAEILLWVGDNIQDFPGLDQSLRTGPLSALAPFGDRFIIVPNPMYGSWKH